MKEETPLVSIKCLVYNHEKYLHDCLEGIVMQKTNFKFEAIVHDDASTDGSAAIIREYAEKYPDIIKPIYEIENIFSKDHGLLRRIMDDACKGKYVAECEGDDYWIDPYKLQKQVDFMESHNDVSLVFSRCHVLNKGQYIDDQYPHFKGINDCYFSSNQLYSNWIIPTASMLYRHNLFTIYTDERIYAGDIVMSLSLAEKGKVFGMSDYMTVYRLNEEGLTLSRSRNQNLMWRRYIDHVLFLRENFHSVSSQLYNRNEIHYRINYFKTENSRWFKRNWHNIYLASKLNPILFLLIIIKEFALCLLGEN